MEHSIEHSTEYSIDHSTDHSTGRSIERSIEHSIERSIDGARCEALGPRRLVASEVPTPSPMTKLSGFERSQKNVRFRAMIKSGLGCRTSRFAGRRRACAHAQTNVNISPRHVFYARLRMGTHHTSSGPSQRDMPRCRTRGPAACDAGAELIIAASAIPA